MTTERDSTQATNAQAKRRSPVLSSISIEGFKAHFEATSLAIRPLTVLAGANSSGKSSAMQAVLLVKQTIDALPLDTGGLKLDQPNVHFTNAEQLLAHEPGKGEKRKEFSIVFGYSDETSVGISFRQAGHSLEVASTTYGSPGGSERLEKGQAVSLDAYARLMSHISANVLVQRGAKPPAPDRWASFLVPDWSPVVGAEMFQHLLPEIVRLTGTTLQSLIHIPGSRGNPLRSFPRTVAGQAPPGVFTNLAPAILAEWTNQKAPQLEAVNNALALLGLTWKAEATVVDAASIEIRVGRTASPVQGGAQDLVNIADVGFGVSQILPIVVALVYARREQLVYLEQPEIHLHPRAVMSLADLIAEAARRGVRCVVETHSDVLLRRLQWNIARAKGPLKHTDVVFHWFSRNDQGHAQVRSVTPDESGAYGDWPVDFADVDARNAREYIAAAEEHLSDEA